MNTEFKIHAVAVQNSRRSSPLVRSFIAANNCGPRRVPALAGTHTNTQTDTQTHRQTHTHTHTHTHTTAMVTVYEHTRTYAHPPTADLRHEPTHRRFSLSRVLSPVLSPAAAPCSCSAGSAQKYLASHSYGKTSVPDLLLPRRVRGLAPRQPPRLYRCPCLSPCRRSLQTLARTLVVRARTGALESLDRRSE